MPLSSVVGAQSIIKPGVCTSSTRPAVSFEGQMIYETDTDKVLVYNGTAWYPNWNTAWGWVAEQTLATTFTTTSASAVDVTGLSVTFTAIASRKYLITASFNMSNSTNVPAQVFINNGATALAESYYGQVGTGNVQTTMIFAIQTPSAGSVTYKAQASTTGGTLTVYGTSTRASIATRMFVQDIGPA